MKEFLYKPSIYTRDTDGLWQTFYREYATIAQILCTKIHAKGKNINKKQSLHSVPPVPGGLECIVITLAKRFPETVIACVKKKTDLPFWSPSRTPSGAISLTEINFNPNVDNHTPLKYGMK